MDALHSKLENLKEYLSSLGSVAVAFSGGVDSTFLLKTASLALGGRAIAVNVDSVLAANAEKNTAQEFCVQEGIPLCRIEFDALSIDEIRRNAPDRCYFCKKAIFQRILQEAASRGIKNTADGSNTDDMGDYRPGLKALAELEVLSPLRECGLGKADIRALSKEMGLAAHSLPSAACLASRIAYGEDITAEKLRRIDKAEEFLRMLTVAQCRVRLHHNIARIEVPDRDMETVLSHRSEIHAELKELGFDYVALDMFGYRTGSMNEVL